VKLNFALAGNQNAGKTTLFNALTGSSQHVGNFPGVTVEKKEGLIRGKKNAAVVDLPGIYSLSPYSAEEIVTRDYLIENKPDGIINIVDATNLERNLYLTLQLIELGIPMVVALNMMDEVSVNGYSIDMMGLRDDLGVEIVPISANKGEGITELIDKAVLVATTNQKPKRIDFCGGSVHKAIHSVYHLVEDKARDAGLPVRYAATRIVEGDELIEQRLKLPKHELKIINSIVKDMENELGTDREAAMADMRYEFIGDVCRKHYKRGRLTREQLRSVNIDKVLTNKYLAIPIFLSVMGLVFWVTFGLVGGPLSDVLAAGIRVLGQDIDALLTEWGAAPMLKSLIVEGIFSGVGSVLSFLPIVLALFLMMSILEDTGYMARVAFVMDKLLRKIGLSGRSIVPMLIGFGCSVPAIMATRTLPSERNRKMTIVLVPFMSCSAKLTVYAVFVSAFFKGRETAVMISLYVLGIIVGILYGLFFKNTIFKSDPVPFVMELPAYRFPSLRSVVMHMWRRAKEFFVKAFTIILAASVVIWILQSYDVHFVPVADSSQSMLAAIGSFFAPVFKPLGFDDWTIATALITGLTAKEAVVSTLSVLTGAATEAQLALALSSVMSPLAAVSFMVFTLLYMPCVAAMAAIKRELGSIFGAIAAMISQTAIAWLVAFLVYNIGSLFI